MTGQDVDKLAVMEKLRAVGVWDAAEAYREEVRKRLKSEGKGRAEAVNQAWKATCDLFLPLAEQAKPGFQTILPDGAKCFDDALDSEYTETDPMRQMRDAYLWLLAEFPRIVSDHGASSVLDLRKASTRPPVGIAISIGQAWAAKPCRARDGLYREIRTWIATNEVSLADSKPETFRDEGGFLDEIGG